MLAVAALGVGPVVIVAVAIGVVDGPPVVTAIASFVFVIGVGVRQRRVGLASSARALPGAARLPPASAKAATVRARISFVVIPVPRSFAAGNQRLTDVILGQHSPARSEGYHKNALCARQLAGAKPTATGHAVKSCDAAAWKAGVANWQLPNQSYRSRRCVLRGRHPRADRARALLRHRHEGRARRQRYALHKE
jgi:hypothetical protein